MRIGLEPRHQGSRYIHAQSPGSTIDQTPRGARAEIKPAVLSTSDARGRGDLLQSIHLGPSSCGRRPVVRGSPPALLKTLTEAVDQAGRRRGCLVCGHVDDAARKKEVFVRSVNRRLPVAIRQAPRFQISSRRIVIIGAAAQPVGQAEEISLPISSAGSAGADVAAATGGSGRPVSRLCHAEIFSFPPCGTGG